MPLVDVNGTQLRDLNYALCVDRVLVYRQPKVIANDTRSIAARYFQSDDSQISLLPRSDVDAGDSLVAKALNGNPDCVDS